MNQVRAVLNYATSVIDPKKILMGVVLYGYNWEIPWRKGRLASSVSNNEAQNLALNEQVPIQWDEPSASPYFEYTEEGQKHIVWFEDALSVAAKFNLIYDYNLRGVTYWVLPNDFPQNWYLLHDTFDIKKV
jgi:spore germination protein